MFWERFCELCEKEGIKPNPLADLLGIASGSLTKWKRGKLPSTENLIKISSHFGVTVDYLLFGTVSMDNLLPEDREWLDLIHSLPAETQRDFKGAMRLHKDLHDIAPKEDPEEKEMLQAK